MGRKRSGVYASMHECRMCVCERAVKGSFISSVPFKRIGKDSLGFAVHP
jgi:hypothetical protein